MPAAQAHPVTLRPMLPADMPEAIDMWIASWQAAYPAIDFEARRGWAVDHFAGLRDAGAHVVVALQGGDIAGLLTIEGDTGYLDQIVVARDRQGRGIASLLLAEARRLSPAGIELHVNQDNARAIRFYETHGFCVTGPDVNRRSGAPVYRMKWTPTRNAG